MVSKKSLLLFTEKVIVMLGKDWVGSEWESYQVLKWNIWLAFEDRRFCGVVVITSALHAEGREFEPRQNLGIFCIECT